MARSLLAIKLDTRIDLCSEGAAPLLFSCAAAAKTPPEFTKVKTAQQGPRASWRRVSSSCVAVLEYVELTNIMEAATSSLLRGSIVSNADEEELKKVGGEARSDTR